MVSALGLLFSWTGVAVVLLSILHVVMCIFLLAVVLLQRGKTGDVMSAFGAPSQSSYAALSTDDLLTRLTKIGAAIFMMTSLALALLAASTGRSVIEDEEDVPLLSAPEAPGLPEPAATDAVPAEAPVDAFPETMPETP